MTTSTLDLQDLDLRDLEPAHQSASAVDGLDLQDLDVQDLTAAPSLTKDQAGAQIEKATRPQTAFQPPATTRTPLDIGMPPGPTEAEKQAEYALYDEPHPGKGGIYVQPEAQRPTII